VVIFDRLHNFYDFQVVFYRNFVPKTKIFLHILIIEIFDYKNAVTLKTGLEVRKVIGNVTIR